VQAAAISGGVVVGLGSDEDIREFVRPFTRVVNLRGRLAIPAFGDAHVHPVQGGLESLRCNLAGLRTRQEYLDTIAAYSSALPEGAWVLGGGWSMSAFPGGRPNAADLDLVTGGRPAFLPNRDHHSAWVNAAALDVAGITAGTPDPADGRIERDRAGVPAGALHDGAMRLVADYVPAPGQNELTAALLAAQARLHSLGITSIQDACIGDAGELGMPDAFETYRRAAADRLLTCRVTGALWWDRFSGRHQLDTLQARREAADGGGYFRATSVKLMLDGVCETFTAAMGAPSLDQARRAWIGGDDHAAAAGRGDHGRCRRRCVHPRRRLRQPRGGRGRHPRARQACGHRRAHPGRLRGPGGRHRRHHGRADGRQRRDCPRRRIADRPCMREQLPVRSESHLNRASTGR
jgi:predicted amidohydrolase YtcJ